MNKLILAALSLAVLAGSTSTIQAERASRTVTNICGGCKKHVNHCKCPELLCTKMVKVTTKAANNKSKVCKVSCPDGSYEVSRVKSGCPSKCDRVKCMRDEVKSVSVTPVVDETCVTTPVCPMGTKAGKHGNRKMRG